MFATHQSQTGANVCPASSRTPVKAGAATAAALFFVMVMFPAIIAALDSPFVAGWLPLILIFTMPWMAFAAAIGAIIGFLAARAANTALGALIGTVVSLPIGCVVGVAFNSPFGSWDDYIAVIVVAVVPGAVAGAIATVCARNALAIPGWRAYISRYDILLFVCLLAPAFIWWVYLFGRHL
jgi:hypothetical protein